MNNNAFDFNDDLIDAIVVEHLLQEAKHSVAARLFVDPTQEEVFTRPACSCFTDELLDALVAVALRTPSTPQKSAKCSSCGSEIAGSGLSAADVDALASISANLANSIVDDMTQATQLDKREELAWRCVAASSRRIQTDDDVWLMVDQLIFVFQSENIRQPLSEAITPFLSRLRDLRDAAGTGLSLQAEKQRIDLISAIGRCAIAYCRSQVETAIQ